MSWLLIKLWQDFSHTHEDNCPRNSHNFISQCILLQAFFPWVTLSPLLRVNIWSPHAWDFIASLFMCEMHNWGNEYNGKFGKCVSLRNIAIESHGNRDRYAAETINARLQLDRHFWSCTCHVLNRWYQRLKKSVQISSNFIGYADQLHYQVYSRVQFTFFHFRFVAAHSESYS